MAVSSIAPAFADKLPFEKFAFQELEAGLKNKQDNSAVLNGAGRCMGIIGATVESEQLSDIHDPNDNNSDIIQAYMGFTELAIASLEIYYNIPKDGPDLDVTPLLEEAKDSAMYYGRGYWGWIERDDINLKAINNNHPYMIELNKCIEKGLDLRRFYLEE